MNVHKWADVKKAVVPQDKIASIGKAARLAAIQQAVTVDRVASIVNGDAAFLLDYAIELQKLLAEEKLKNTPLPKPSPKLMRCPSCGERHVDSGMWATRLHHTHRCVPGPDGQGCGHEWREEEYVYGV